MKYGLRAVQATMDLKDVTVTSPLSTINSQNGAFISVSSGTYTTTDDYANQIHLSQNSFVEILGGKFVATGENAYIVYGDKGTGDSITIAGGSFEGMATAFHNSENYIPANKITGGTYNIDMTDYIGEGFTCKDNGDGTYTVTE